MKRIKLRKQTKITCPECEGDAVFCFECGTPIRAEFTGTGEDCKGWNFCDECGSAEVETYSCPKCGGVGYLYPKDFTWLLNKLITFINWLI